MAGGAGLCKTTLTLRADFRVSSGDVIDTEEKLAAFLPVVRAADWIAVDTEADSLHAYPEKVCLIQISTSAGIASLIRWRTSTLIRCWTRFPGINSSCTRRIATCACFTNITRSRWGRSSTRCWRRDFGHPRVLVSARWWKNRFGVKLDKGPKKPIGPGDP